MTDYTVRSVNNQCQIIRIDNSGHETVICTDYGEVTVEGRKYTTVRRQPDGKCCIFRINPVMGGQQRNEFILEEGQTVST